MQETSDVSRAVDAPRRAAELARIDALAAALAAPEPAALRATRLELHAAWRELLDALRTGRWIDAEHVGCLGWAAVQLDQVPEAERPWPEPAAPVCAPTRAALSALADAALREWALLGFDEAYSASLAGRGRPDELRAWLEHELDAAEPGLVRVACLARLADLARDRGAYERWSELVDRLRDELEPLASTRAEAASPWRAFALEERAQGCLELGLLDEAASAVTELEQMPEAADEAQRAQRAVIAANVRARANLHALAVARLQRVLDDRGASGITDARLRAALAVRLGYSLSELERAQSSRDVRARAVLESAWATSELDDHDALTAELCLADLCLRAHERAAATAWIERARARLGDRSAADGEHAHEALLLDTLDARLARGGAPSRAEQQALLARLDAAYERLLASWAALHAREGPVGFLHSGERRALIAELVQLERALHPGTQGVERALGVLLRAQALGTLARAAGPTAATLDAARAELCASGHGVLVYLGCPESSLVFAFDAQRIDVAELAGIDALELAWNDVLPALSRPPRSAERGELDAALRAFSSAVLPPVIAERVRAWRCVSIAGADMLGNMGTVYFEALPIEGLGELGSARAVDIVPSLPAAVALARRGAARDAERAARAGAATEEALDAVLVGAPAHSPSARANWPRLVELELGADGARELMAAFASERVALHVGRDATALQLEPASLRGARVLHLYTHGVPDPARLRPPGLLLASADPLQSGLYSCDDVEAAGARCLWPPLVILSACGAALGPARQGEDQPAHLGGAFLSAGAQCVVLSRHDLDARATFELTRAMQRALVAGASPAEAMRAARDELAARTEFAHPYYRDLMQVVGLGQRPLFTPR